MKPKKRRLEEIEAQFDEYFQNWVAKTPTNMGAKAQALEGKHAVYTVMSLYASIPDEIINRLTEFLLTRQLAELAVMDRHTNLMECQPKGKLN